VVRIRCPKLRITHLYLSIIESDEARQAKDRGPPKKRPGNNLKERKGRNAGLRGKN